MIPGMITDNEKALDYYRSAALQQYGEFIPRYVPKRIILPFMVHGDGPFRTTRAYAGEHNAQCNKFGAVSVSANDGRLLGIKLNEFKVLEWADNDKVE